jgi:Putative phage serine protease XkdF
VKLFADLFKDVTSSGVHATTAIGNEGERKRRAFATITAETSRSKEMDDGQGGLAADDAAMLKFDKANVVKVDADLGLVFGFAIVCKRDGENYFDLQGDHITESAMLKASADFMLHSRVSKDMHEGDADGTVVFAFPMTSDIAKAMDITTKQTGLLIAMKPSAAVLAKFKDGIYTGFSIGGSRIKDEVVA